MKSLREIIFHIGNSLFIACLALLIFSLFSNPASAAVSKGSTADHSKFEELKGPFKSGPEVTKACLKCHTEAAKQVHKTTHWTWQFKNEDTGQLLGKRNVVNNFCISTQSNIGACSSCHVGYGWKDKTYDFTVEENVDCLVCHDKTGAYDKKKLREGKTSMLAKSAQTVGRTSRTSCGACHFKGGGGKAVKHGDLDPSMDAPDIFVDVHMDADGLNFSCSTCHTTDAHMVTGSRYTPKAQDISGIDVPGKSDGSRATCVSCHGDRPMKDEKLNDHTDRIACQTCHIPHFARGDYPSKMVWDWSTAGKMNDKGKPFSTLDQADNEIYSSKKGDFVWQSNVVPEYRWFNGSVEYTLPTDKFDPSKPLEINRFKGSADDPNSLIWPIKLMRGKQPYDTVNKTLVTPHTTGKDGYWKTFDWQSAITKGMEIAELPYSGQYGFVATEMSWPIAHMVAPAKEALGCEDCHSRDGRLAEIDGIYIPGRDTNPWLDIGGFAILAMTVFGVGAHGALRFFFNKRNDKA
ncbi:MAG: tetrathionate reductase family octaheme c-type cytochrome [Alphaproteobacteria bacterium]|nr:tetrathionate reductase family octaheme c-type cytochrome [Alphaproteobacteria bacterium]